MKNHSELLQHIVKQEKRLHQPSFRQDKQTVENLLHAEFTEIGRSGTLTHRKEIIDALQNEQSQPVIQSEGFELSAINDNVVILTYRSFVGCAQEAKTRHTLRSSVWVRSEQHDWQMRFHQGTPTEAW